MSTFLAAKLTFTGVAYLTWRHEDMCVDGEAYAFLPLDPCHRPFGNLISLSFSPTNEFINHREEYGGNSYLVLGVREFTHLIWTNSTGASLTAVPLDDDFKEWQLAYRAPGGHDLDLLELLLLGIQDFPVNGWDAMDPNSSMSNEELEIALDLVARRNPPVNFPEGVTSAKQGLVDYLTTK